MVYRQFTYLFPRSEDLEQFFRDSFDVYDEMWKDENWIFPISKIFQIMWSVCYSYSYNKYFIWNDEIEDEEDEESEFRIGINAQFGLRLWQKWMTLYFNQTPYVANNINELQDYKKRGNNSETTDEGASTSYSQPTESGYQWDTNKDAPTDKRASYHTQNVTNRVREVLIMTEADIRIYFSSFMAECEYMFISKPWVDKYLARMNHG